MDNEKFRPYIVTYDGNRCVSSMTRKELEERAKAGDVDWVIHGRQRLDNFELLVFKAYLEVKSQMEEEGSPSNIDIMENVNLQIEDRQVSRNAVARARRRIANKMNFKGGW